MDLKEVEVYVRGCRYSLVLCADYNKFHTQFFIEYYVEDEECGCWSKTKSEFLGDDLDIALERFNGIVIDAEECN